MQYKILRLPKLKEAHIGVYLCKELVQVLKNLGVAYSIRSITYDNATNNNTLITTFEQHVASNQSPLSWPFDATEHSLRCFAHIMNIAV